MAPAVATYAPRDPSRTVLYHVIAEHLETFLAALDADPDATGLPAYVEREFYDYLQCGMGVTGCPRRLHAANGSSSSRVSIGSTSSRNGYNRWVSFPMRYRMKSSQSPLR